MRQLVSLPDTKGKLRQRGKKLEWQTFFSAPEQETYILFAFSLDMQSHFWTLKIVHPFVIIESEMWGSLHSVIQLQWDELLLRGTANWAAVFNNLNTKISPGEETVLPPTGGFFFFFPAHSLLLWWPGCGPSPLEISANRRNPCSAVSQKSQSLSVEETKKTGSPSPILFPSSDGLISHNPWEWNVHGCYTWRAGWGIVRSWSTNRIIRRSSEARFPGVIER